jgi:SET domain-containing protein
VSGAPTSQNKELYLVDAFNVSQSNWTRYVNCGLKNRFNNLDVSQVFNQIYYLAKRDIKPGEELFIDYGPDYRKINLGMKGRY